MKTQVTILTLIAVFVVFAGFASADIITFTKTNLAADGSNLNNSGTLLEAPNFSDGTPPGSATFTLNGINFVGKGYASSASGTYWSMSSNNNEGNGKTSGLTTSDAAYYLVYDNWWSGGDRTLSLTGLTAGNSYRLQVVWSTDGSRDAFLSNGDDPSNNNSGTQWYGPSQGGPGLITAEWTESGTTQNLIIERNSQASVVSGFVLQDITPIPEPGGLALAALGMLGVLAVRRRRTR